MSEPAVERLREKLRERRHRPAPECPIDAAHGPLLALNGRLWCPHRGHGGNGRSFEQGER